MMALLLKWLVLHYPRILGQNHVFVSPFFLREALDNTAILMLALFESYSLFHEQFDEFHKDPKQVSCLLAWGTVKAASALRNIHFYGHDAATAKINLCHWATSQSIQSTQDHIIHPAALDAVLQISSIPITNGGEKVVPILLPTIFRELWISAGILNSGHSAKAQDASNAISIFTQAYLHGPKEEASIVAVNAESKKLQIFGEFVASSAGLSIMPSENLVTSEGLCYNVIWKPNMDLLTQTQPSSEAEKTFVPPVPDLLSVEKKVLIQSSLSRLLESPQDQKTLVGSPSLTKYLDWAQNYLDTNKNQLDLSAYDESTFHTLCNEIESNDPEGELLVRVVKSLKCIFEVFQPNNASLFTGNGLLDLLAHNQPNVKILEIGAGTGSTTESVLQELMFCEDISGERFHEPRIVDYIFTDISPRFSEPARERLREYTDRMIFSTLDIERCPQEQGFRSSEYDLTIASNVLHATASLTDVLHNIHTMLKPDGRLVLCEASPTNIESAFMFGLLPGWWLATEEFRNRGPLMTRESWNTTLLQCGFAGIDFAFPAVEDDIGNFMVGRIRMVPTEVNSTPKKIIILHKDDRIQVEIANHLEGSYESSIQQECSSISVGEAQLHIGLFEDALCISLFDIQDSFLHRISDENYALLQTECLSTTTIIWIGCGSITENSHSSMMRCVKSGPIEKNQTHVCLAGCSWLVQFVDENNSAFEIGPDEVEVKVKAAGLNFLEILIGLGQEASNDDLGCECSGVVTRLGGNAAAHFQIGDRVSCMCQGSMGTYARSETYFSVTEIPDSMTFSTAAGFSVTLLTAYHAIMNLARMKYGESILVHSGAGGLG
ncbi:hypothetical protein EAF00_010076 [Botryotinia globosa]|nr:hypothetical protein EAF00_010076 [Botryotinia globosa]